jgi:SAM-dependent methyltransferase
MNDHPEFLNPSIFRRLDLFLSRKAILHALTGQLPNLKGTILDVGCGRMPYKTILLAPPSRVTKYIGLDLASGYYQQFGPFDLTWDGYSIPLPDRCVDCAIATELLEQCPDPEIVLRETARVLKPDGIFLFTVPFMWPVHDPPLDQYRFTPYAMQRLLQMAGFTDIRLEMFGGWDASLAQMIALWVRRRPMRPLFRKVLTCAALPLVYLFSRTDRVPVKLEDFQATVMITGFSGTARVCSVPVQQR